MIRIATYYYERLIDMNQGKLKKHEAKIKGQSTDVYLLRRCFFLHPHIFIVEGAVDALPKIWGGESTKTKLGLKII